MYKDTFTDFTSADAYRTLGEKVADRHPHFVILIPPGKKPVAVRFKDNRDLLPWCDLFWDKYPTGTVRIPEYDDVRGVQIPIRIISANEIPEL